MERRRDPRTDSRYSLRNLLRTRAERERLALAVVGTADGLLLAGSREDRAASRVAGHAAYELFRGAGAGAGRCEREGSRTGARLECLGFEAGGAPLFLAILAESAASAASGGSGASRAGLEALADRVRAILAEGHRPAAVA